MMARRRVSAYLLLTLATAVGVTACAGPPPVDGGAVPPAPGPGPGGPWGMMGGMHGYGPGMSGYGGMMMGGPTLRHRWTMMQGIPAAYADQRDPLPAAPRVISEGKGLFLANCSACHGNQGEGNGPAAAEMSPPPANLRWLVRRPMAGDGYLMWAISEGGAQLGTGMPAFKDALSETDRWKIVRFLRTL